jgi:carbonic anhydrase
MKLSIIATLIGAISAASTGSTKKEETDKVEIYPSNKKMEEYDYAKLGKDWPSLQAPEGEINHCGDELNQSPINLMQPIGSYGWAYGETVPKTHDQLEMNYKDLKKKIKVEWDTNTVKVAMADTESDENYFYTKLGKDKYGGNAEKFFAQEFMFHHPSEHTVNGKYHDLEMHTIHLADT